MKTCSKCRLVKDYDQFHASNHSKDGRKPHCKDCQKLANQKRRSANLPHILTLERATRIRNIVKVKVYSRKKYERTKAAIKAGLRPPLVRDKVKRAVYEHRRRAKLVASSGHFTPEDLVKIHKLQKGKCANPLCRVKLGRKFHMDHIMPLALGGSNARTNIQILCPGCNLRKARKHPVVFAQENGLLL